MNRTAVGFFGLLVSVLLVVAFGRWYDSNQQNRLPENGTSAGGDPTSQASDEPPAASEPDYFSLVLDDQECFMSAEKFGWLRQAAFVDSIELLESRDGKKINFVGTDRQSGESVVFQEDAVSERPEGRVESLDILAFLKQERAVDRRGTPIGAFRAFLQALDRGDSQLALEAFDEDGFYVGHVFHDREAYVRQALGGDKSKRIRVESLLRLTRDRAEILYTHTDIFANDHLQVVKMVKRDDRWLIKSWDEAKRLTAWPADEPDPELQSPESAVKRMTKSLDDNDRQGFEKCFAGETIGWNGQGPLSPRLFFDLAWAAAPFHQGRSIRLSFRSVYLQSDEMGEALVKVGWRTPSRRNLEHLFKLIRDQFGNWRIVALNAKP